MDSRMRSGSPQPQALSQLNSSQLSAASVGGSNISSAQLHTQLLASEIVKLRKELATLQGQAPQSSGMSEALRLVSTNFLPAFSMQHLCRLLPPRHAHHRGAHLSRNVRKSYMGNAVQAQIEKQRKEAEKAEVVAQANSEKQVLANEIKNLRALVQQGGSSSNPLAERSGPVSSVALLPDNVVDALERRKAFEEQFSLNIRSLREELQETSIKRLSSRSQTPQGIRALLLLCDERINKIMAEAVKVACPLMTALIHCVPLSLILVMDFLRPAHHNVSIIYGPVSQSDVR